MRPSPVEMQLLASPARLLDELANPLQTNRAEARLQILEAASSIRGGYDLHAYFELVGIIPAVAIGRLAKAGKQILQSLAATPIPVPLALSALAREPISEVQQRSTGAFYTDFRLARHMAKQVAPLLNTGSKVIDPSSGSGILLVTVALAVCGDNRQKINDWLASNVYASDLSPNALRGVLLSLSSMTNDLAAIRALTAHLCCQDSLMAECSNWKSLSPQGFDLVIGNPPWGKIKLNRHDYLKARGADRHYGAAYHQLEEADYLAEKTRVERYADRLVQVYPLLGSAEPDVYMAFLELFLRLAKPGGLISVLLPGGLIRSQGTRALRQHLFDTTGRLRIEILENRARFFAIDSRFKFLHVSCIKRDAAKSTVQGPAIHLLHAKGTGQGVVNCGEAWIDRADLVRMRPDLTIPEVRSDQEWRIFRAMTHNGVAWDTASEWRAQMVREVDMTRERRHFMTAPAAGALPLVEGRMVHQHRFGGKAYLSGSGRRAVWKYLSMGQSRIAPQFWIAPTALGEKIRARSNQVRAGFCDIAGQTNERSMLAALIPAGVICGNKVPTVCFPDDPSEARLFLWLAIVNSLPFDWLLRRVLTTTINYFLLLSVPLPRIDKASLAGQKLARAARELYRLDRMPTADAGWRAAALRGHIDVEVAIAYGLGYEDLVILLEDFPLLDRGQPPLPGEGRSTVTRDYLLSLAAGQYGVPGAATDLRVAAARDLGAVAYVPSLAMVDSEEQG